MDCNSNDSWESEKETWRAAAHGDEDAREQLILSYRPLVYWCAHKLGVDSGKFADLVQEGTIALINAVDRFDVELGHRFTTFACYRIRGQMLNYLQRSEAKAPVPVDLDDEEHDPETGFGDVEEIITLREGLLHLPPREAAVLQAMVVESRSAKELAHDCSLNLSGIYRLKRQAISRLKNWLKLKDATSGT